MAEKTKMLSASENEKLDSIIEASFNEQDALLTAADRRKFAVTGIFELLGSLKPAHARYETVRVPFVNGCIAMEASRNPDINYEVSKDKTSPYGGARSAAQTRWTRYCDAIPTICEVPKNSEFKKPERPQSAATKKSNTPEKKATATINKAKTKVRKERQAGVIAKRDSATKALGTIAKACYTAGNADDLKQYNALLKKLETLKAQIEKVCNALSVKKPTSKKKGSKRSAKAA